MFAGSIGFACGEISWPAAILRTTPIAKTVTKELEDFIERIPYVDGGSVEFS